MAARWLHRGHCLPRRSELFDAINDEETATGLRSIAVPVLNGAGKVIAGLNIGVQSSQVTVETMVSRFLPEMLGIQTRLRRLLA